MGERRAVNPELRQGLREVIRRCAGGIERRPDTGSRPDASLPPEVDCARILLEVLKDVGERLGARMRLATECVDEVVSYTVLRVLGLKTAPELEDDTHAHHYLAAALRMNLRRYCVEKRHPPPPAWCGGPSRARRTLVETVIPAVTRAKGARAGETFLRRVRELIDYVCQVSGSSDRILRRESGWSEDYEPDDETLRKAANSLYQAHSRARRELREETDRLMHAGQIEASVAAELHHIIDDMSLRKAGPVPFPEGGWRF